MPGITGAIRNTIRRASAGPVAVVAALALPLGLTTTTTNVTWTLQNPPVPPGFTTGPLFQAVSCTSANACTAVGNSSGSNQTFAEGWDGTSWTLEPTPGVAGILSGVSCAAARVCTAVGRSVSSAHPPAALAERWDGTSWTVQPTTAPPGASSSSLSAVSCPSRTSCVAVGSYFISQPLPFFATWNGRTWTAHRIPGPAAQLNGVSCLSATSCTAVGTVNSLPFAESWDGTSWTVQPTPLPNGVTTGDLTGVSCSSATYCLAVGGYILNTHLLAELWNGTSWTVQPANHPFGAHRSVFLAVSCTSTGKCTAVGNQSVGSNQLPLAEHWNGTRLALQGAVSPDGSGGNSLNGVSCSTPSICTAAGVTVLSTGQVVPLAEQSSFNG